MIREITKEERKPIVDIYRHIGYFRGNECVYLDGDFDVNDLKRIATWLEKRIIDDKIA